MIAHQISVVFPSNLDLGGFPISVNFGEM